MSIWTMGINQSTHGSDGVVGINNLNLVTGNIGKPGGTSLSITGQCNAMGTREWSSCSGLPGYRALEKPEDREEIAKFWGIDPEFFPKQRGLTETDIFPAIETGEIKGLWLVATNPDDLDGEYATHPQDAGETGMSGGAGCLCRRGNQPIRAYFFTGWNLGREGRRIYQYRAPGQSYPSG